MPFLLPSALKKQYERIEALRKKPMEPREYCRRWVPKFYRISPDERGYRKACIKELAKVTTLEEGTINNWGSQFEGRPDYVLVMLRMADMINQIREIISLPPDFPKE
jgi:hypothetical protein